MQNNAANRSGISGCIFVVRVLFVYNFTILLLFNLILVNWYSEQELSNGMLTLEIAITFAKVQVQKVGRPS